MSSNSGGLTASKDLVIVTRSPLQTQVVDRSDKSVTWMAFSGSNPHHSSHQGIVLLHLQHLLKNG